MNERERAINALLYRQTDKLPLSPGGPRESTLKRWHIEGLPEGADWFPYILGTLGIDYEFPKNYVSHSINIRMIPTFEEKVLRHENGHYVVQDWMGAVTEISDRYDYTYIRNAVDFVTRKWHKFPVETAEDWQEMRKRYDPDEPSRYPENFGELNALMEDREYVSRFYMNGPFWQMREWMGFENLCVAFMDRPGLIADMAGFWCDYGLRLIENVAGKVPLDCLNISEDMAYKAHPMISPALAREYLLPVYKKWSAAAKKYGVRLIDMDSDGYVADLIPIWIEGGINVCDPVEVAAHNDIAAYAGMFGTDMAYTGGVDKRAIAAGGKTMEAEVLRVTGPFLKRGGLLPGCDHGVPHDISLANFTEYTGLLAKLSGWL